MKLKYIVLLLISISFFYCIKEQKENKITDELILEPINYNFDKLKLHLNSSLSDSTNENFWKWNHMASPNSRPDSLGIEYYKNLEQPSFEFNGEKTLPALYALTDGGKLVEFSAIYIFNLPNQEKEIKQKLLDKVTLIDLLKDKKIRQEIIEKGVYSRKSNQVIETIKLEISKEQYGYDNLTYDIKINATR